MAKFCPVFAPFAPFLPPFGLFFARLGFRIAWTVLLLASLAVRRSPLARAAKNGQFWPVFGLFWPVFGLFLRRAVTVVSGANCQPSQHLGTARGAQGWMGLSYSRDCAASRFACCPSLAACSRSQKWPVLAPLWAVLALFGLFLRGAATVVSGAKCQPSQHLGTSRVAQGWMGLSYSRDGAASRCARCPLLPARSCSQKWPVLARFWAVWACFWAIFASLQIFFFLVWPKMPCFVLLRARRCLVVDCLV